jgi:uncharacterized protein (DUF1330 family)
MRFEKLMNFSHSLFRIASRHLKQRSYQMPVQALAMITVTDKETLGAYRERAAEALAKHGGSVVAADPAPLVLETASDKPDLAALLSFPTVEAAKAWREDPALTAVHALRNKGGKSTIVVLPS